MPERKRIDVAIEFSLHGTVQIAVEGQTVLKRSTKGMKANRTVGKRSKLSKLSE
jgi:collagenase-like PrtC family protease